MSYNMVETPINMTESFQIYQKLKKKKNNKNIRSEREQFIFVYTVYKIYAAKKKCLPMGEAFTWLAVKKITQKKMYLCVINANRV